MGREMATTLDISKGTANRGDGCWQQQRPMRRVAAIEARDITANEDGQSDGPVDKHHSWWEDLSVRDRWIGTFSRDIKISVQQPTRGVANELMTEEGISLADKEAAVVDAVNKNGGEDGHCHGHCRWYGWQGCQILWALVTTADTTTNLWPGLEDRRGVLLWVHLSVPKERS